MSDLLDLSKFIPDPGNTNVIYKYHCELYIHTVYARKSDNILPFDKLIVKFSKEIEIIYPKSIDYRPFITLFVNKQENYKTVRNLLFSLFTKSDMDSRDLELTMLLFIRIQEIILTMDKPTLIYTRSCMMLCPCFPQEYHNFMMVYFDQLID